MSAILLEDLEFSWGSGFRLGLARWEIPQGARAAVLGPSGCGKSTLLRLISGELLPARGRVEVGGVSLSSLSEGARRRWRIRNLGFIFQDFPLVEHLEAEENVLLPYRLNPTLSLDRAARGRARGLLAELGVPAGARPGALSQGERQRVAVARAMVTEPRILLADEPTAGLDPERADAVLELLSRACGGRGMTLVMVTHDPRLKPHFDPILELAGRVSP